MISEDEKSGHARIGGREKWTVLGWLEPWPFPSPTEVRRRYLLQIKNFQDSILAFFDPETALITMYTAKCDEERKNDPRTPSLWLSAWELCQ